MSDFSQIACEICRNKKRKCDRKIPTCSQCMHAGQTCTYPGTSKRGLPSGYLASIEDRLAQTETALLQALSTIYGFQEDHRLSPVAKPRDMEFNEVRIAKVEEWQKYPLSTQEHQREWMRYKLATTSPSIPLETTERQEDHVSQARDERQSQGHHESSAGRKRQKTADELGGNRHLLEAYRSECETRVLPATTLRAAHERVAPLDPDSGLVTSTPWAQGTTTRSTEPHRASNPPSMPMPDLPDGTEALSRLEQTSSKAKRLSTLHSRKYF